MAIKAIIAIGNPGKEYANTLHNAGVLLAQTVQALAVDDGNAPDFLYSQRFMNQSGLALRELLENKPYGLQDVIVFHDDSDLFLGNFKIAKGGSSGGHKGVEDIIRQFGTENFWRVKVGIRNPKEKQRAKAKDFVLKRIGFFQKKSLLKLAPQIWERVKKI